MRTVREQDTLDTLVEGLGDAAALTQQLLRKYLAMRMDVTADEKDLLTLLLLRYVHRLLVEVKGVKAYSQLTK